MSLYSMLLSYGYMTAHTSLHTHNYIYHYALYVGTNADDYSSSSPTGTILYSSAPPDPPVLNTAVFAASGASVTITFSSQTDYAATVLTTDVNWACSVVFTFLGSDETSCSWIDSLTVVATFPANENAVLLEPLGIVALNENATRAACSAENTAACPDYLYSIASNVTSASPASPVSPSVVWSAPSAIGSLGILYYCDVQCCDVHV